MSAQMGRNKNLEFLGFINTLKKFVNNFEVLSKYKGGESGER